ncbi:hypothetical protein TNCV_3721141 [Trichonephila clavipes]|nr:hypothetical protein TNCV_3721141 [Trichonephila clavipes]
MEVSMGRRQGSTRNRRHDLKSTSARRLRMIREDTGAPSEGATCAWMLQATFELKPLHLPEADGLDTPPTCFISLQKS